MAFALGLLASLVCLPSGAGALLTRPDIAGDRIVFCAEDDIWIAEPGRPVRRLTTTPTLESDPSFSPDGTLVAFTSYQNGSGNVYVVSAGGGAAKRLTYGSDRVLGWTPNGRIAYRTNNARFQPDGASMQTIASTGGAPIQTPLYEVSACAYEKDTSAIYTRFPVYTDSNPGWRGGQTNRLCRYDFARNVYSELTPKSFQSVFPCPVGSDVYFLADRDDRTFNLFCLSKGKLIRLTSFKEDGIRSLQTDGRRLVFERMGSLTVFDPVSREMRPFDVGMPPPATPNTKEVVIRDWLEEATLSPDGERLAVQSRGNIYLRTKGGEFETVDASSASDDVLSRWSPDGQTLAYFSDRTGELDLYLYNLPRKSTRRVGFVGDLPSFCQWSPDGRSLIYELDRRGVYEIDASTGKVRTVLKTDLWTLKVSIDPAGRWLAVVRATPHETGELILVDLQSGASARVTDPRYSDVDCAFSGNRLYFLSRRNARLARGDLGYGMVLQGGVRLLAIDPPLSTGKVDAKDLRERTSLAIAEIGDYNRLDRLPGGSLLVGDGDRLRVLDGTTLVPTEWPSRLEIDGSFGVALSGGRVSVVHLADTKSTAIEWPLPTTTQTIDLREEWKQIYWDAWRFQRDHFFDAKMKGLDWKSIGDRYARYLPRLRTRSELNLLLTRMMGELGASHVAIYAPGDVPRGGETEFPAALGCNLAWDGKGLRIGRIFAHRPDLSSFGQVLDSPIGSLRDKVKTGDYLVAIDGTPIDATTNPDLLLMGKDGKSVELEIASTLGRRKVTVKAISSNGSVAYEDFVARSREYVERLSGGRIGYVHVFDTNTQGPTEFGSTFFGGVSREAMIVDARWNRGGNLQSGIVPVLQGRSYAVEQQRYGVPTADTIASPGPHALIVNEWTASGGDLLAYEWRKKRVGPIVGSRTAGRMIGVHAILQTVDGGQIATSESHNLDTDSRGEVGEGVGVEPANLVDLRPDLFAAGRDPQLEEAVRLLLRRLKAGPH